MGAGGREYSITRAPRGFEGGDFLCDKALRGTCVRYYVAPVQSSLQWAVEIENTKVWISVFH